MWGIVSCCHLVFGTRKPSIHTIIICIAVTPTQFTCRLWTQSAPAYLDAIPCLAFSKRGTPTMRPDQLPDKNPHTNIPTPNVLLALSSCPPWHAMLYTTLVGIVCPRPVTHPWHRLSRTYDPCRNFLGRYVRSDLRRRLIALQPVPKPTLLVFIATPYYPLSTDANVLVSYSFVGSQHFDRITSPLPPLVGTGLDFWAMTTNGLIPFSN